MVSPTQTKESFPGACNKRKKKLEAINSVCGRFLLFVRWRIFQFHTVCCYIGSLNVVFLLWITAAVHILSCFICRRRSKWKVICVCQHCVQASSDINDDIDSSHSNQNIPVQKRILISTFLTFISSQELHNFTLITFLSYRIIKTIILLYNKTITCKLL